MRQILNKVAHHLLDAAQEIFNSIQRDMVLLIGFLIKISTKEVPHAILHYSFFYFWKVVHIQLEILDQLRGFLAVFVCAQGFDQLHLESGIVGDQ